MEEKLQRLLSWAAGNPQGPVTLELNVTNLCNLRCLSCWQRAAAGFEAQRELKAERLLELVDEAADLGVTEVRIPGSGEPWMRSDALLPVLERIKAHGMRGLLICNGTLLNQQRLTRLVDLGWDNLTISIESASHRIHDRMRGKWGTLRRVTKAIKLLNQLKRQKNSDKPLLRFNTVLTAMNYRSLPKLVEFAHRHGCAAISVQPMTVFSQLGERIKIDPLGQRAMQPYLKKATLLARERGIFTNLESFLDSELVEKSNRMDEVIMEMIQTAQPAGQEPHPFLAAPCFEPFYNMIVLPEGQVGPCSVFGGVGGDDAAQRSLAEIWHGPVFTRVRELLLKQILAEFCARCCVPVFMENQRLRQQLRQAFAAAQV